NSAICRLSNVHPGAALDFRQRTCDEQRSWGTQPPNMSMTDRREPADARTAPQAATTAHHHHQPDNGEQPLPLDTRTSIWATQRSRGLSALGGVPDDRIARARTYSRRRSRGRFCPIGAVWRRPARLLLGHGWSHPPAGRRAPAARPHHKRRQASRTLYAIWQSSALGGRRSRGCWPAEQQLAAPEEIDLSASYAYPDSEPDLRMLRLVGHPVVVNPDAELHRIARGG